MSIGDVSYLKCYFKPISRIFLHNIICSIYKSQNYLTPKNIEQYEKCKYCLKYRSMNELKQIYFEIEVFTQENENVSLIWKLLANITNDFSVLVDCRRNALKISFHEI